MVGISDDEIIRDVRARALPEAPMTKAVDESLCNLMVPHFPQALNF
jgi:hypothetical protein